MSEFLKRWSSRKREARKHQVLQPREEGIPEAVAVPIEGSGEGEQPDLVQDNRVVSTDNGSGGSQRTTAQSDKVTLPDNTLSDNRLPDKEALRAMFRTHQPDGLDDYTQDVSQPELLPAALSAGLRNWVVDQLNASDNELANPVSSAIEPAVGASVAETPPQRAANHVQPPTQNWDVLAHPDGQNVPMEDDQAG